MKRSRRQGSPRILKTDLPSLLLSWLKGVWGSLRRFVMRLLRPNRGRRNYIIQPEKPHTCPLVGVEQLKQAGALTVGNLMEKVQWHPPEEPPEETQTPEEALETFLDAIAAVPKVHSLKLAKPHISPLVGIEGFRQAADSLTVGDLIRKVRWLDERVCPLAGIRESAYSESLSVGNLMESVLWRVHGEAVDARTEKVRLRPAGESPQTFLEPITTVTGVRSLKLAKPHISPLVGIEGFRQASDSLTVGDLIRKVRWLDDRVCPLAGIGEIGYAESLSVSNLMEKVLWQFPSEAAETFVDLNLASSIAPAEEALSPKAHIRPLVCPLLGVKQLSYTESLTVSNLMSSVQWQVIQKASKALPKPSSSSNMASIQDEINWD